VIMGYPILINISMKSLSFAKFNVVVTSSNIAAFCASRLINEFIF